MCFKFSRTGYYSLYKVVWQIPKLIVAAYKKMFCCSKLILLQRNYTRNMLLPVVVYLLIDTYWYILLLYYPNALMNLIIYFLLFNFLWDLQGIKEILDITLTSYWSLKYCVSCKFFNNFLNLFLIFSSIILLRWKV